MSRVGYKDFIISKTYVYEDGSQTTENTEATATQSFKEAKEKGFLGTFSDFLKEIKESGVIEGISGIFYKGEKEKKDKDMDKDKEKIFGLPKMVVYGLGALIVVGIGFGIYKAVKK